MNANQETLIIGAGLTGLLLAHRLKKVGLPVSIVEARDNLGGRFRRLSTPEFYPASDEVMATLEYAKSVSPTALQLEVVEHHPQIYDDGRWRAFAGFGDSDFKSIDELGFFGEMQEVRVNPGLDQMVRALIEQLPIAAQTLNTVTGLQVTEGRITGVTLNGEKTIHPETVIFTAHPAFLNDLIEGEGISAKHRTRLAKMNTWTSVNLELHHSPPLTGEPSVLFFNHNAKDFEPVVGRVSGDRSLWMTLVPSERELDIEFIGQNIKHIKRQLKRSWSLDKLSPEEKIYVQAHAYGQQSLKTKHPYRLPEIKNLFLANHILAGEPGLLGSLEAARAVESLLVDPTRADVTSIEDSTSDH